MASETVICTYRVRSDAEPAFRRLLERHWETLHDLGFVTDDTSVVLRRVDEPTYVEIFTWVEGGFGQAHEHPEVLAIWEPMEPLLEDRGGRLESSIASQATTSRLSSNPTRSRREFADSSRLRHSYFDLKK